MWRIVSDDMYKPCFHFLYHLAVCYSWLPACHIRYQETINKLGKPHMLVTITSTAVKQPHTWITITLKTKHRTVTKWSHTWKRKGKTIIKWNSNFIMTRTLNVASLGRTRLRERLFTEYELAKLSITINSKSQSWKILVAAYSTARAEFECESLITRECQVIYSMAHADIKCESLILRECQVLYSQGQGREPEYSKAWMFKGWCKPRWLWVLYTWTHLPLLREYISKQLLRAQCLPWPRVYSIDFLCSCISYAICWSA